MSIVAYEVTYYSQDFGKSADRLVSKKKFRQLPAQIAELVSEFEKGIISGDVLIHSDIPPYDVYKIRLPNKDMNVGKSDGYRVIYLARHDRRTVAFLFIYYKKEHESLSDTYVKALVDGYFLDLLPEEE